MKCGVLCLVSFFLLFLLFYLYVRVLCLTHRDVKLLDAKKKKVYVYTYSNTLRLTHLCSKFCL